VLANYAVRMALAGRVERRVPQNRRCTKPRLPLAAIWA
jgi:hypothetical protein